MSLAFDFFGAGITMAVWLLMPGCSGEQHPSGQPVRDSGEAIDASLDATKDGPTEVPPPRCGPAESGVSTCPGPVFGQPIVITLPAVPQGAGAADFNADGFPDLVEIANSDIYVLVSRGHGYFAPPIHVASATDLLDVAAGDLNADGLADIVFANSDGLGVILTRPGLTFDAPVSYPVESAWEVAVADLNADGYMDMLAGTSGTPTAGSALVTFLSRGGGGFFGATSYQAGSRPTGVAVGDFNADGMLDVAASDQGGTIAILLAIGGGRLGASTLYTLGGALDAIALSDFDGDGHPDLAASSSGGVQLLQGMGDGSFRIRAPLMKLGGVARAGDFNGDGHADLVAGNIQGNGILLCLGNGDFTFQPVTAYPDGQLEGVPEYALLAADLDCDGRRDVLTGTRSLNVFLSSACAP